MMTERRRLLATVAIATGLGAMRFAFPPDRLTPVEGNVLLIIAVAIVAWIFRPAPYSIIGFQMLIAFWLVGMDQSIVFSGFASEGFFFFFGVLLLSRVITEVNLHVVIAQMIVRRISNVWHLTLLTPFILFLMALPVPSATARTIALKPIFEALVGDNERAAKHAMISLGPINRIGGRAYLSGGLAAILTATVLGQYGYTITWMNWLAFMWPPALLLIVLSTIGITLCYHWERGNFRGENGTETLDLSKISVEHQSFGREQKIVTGLVVVIIGAWIASSLIGYPEFIPLIGLLSLSFFHPIDIADTETLTGLNWDLLFFFGTALSLPNVLQTTDIGPYIVTNLSRNLLSISANFTMFLLVLMLVLVILRVFLIGATFIIVGLPLVIELANTLGYDPLLITLVSLLSGSVIFFPMQTPATLVAFQGEYLTQRDTLVAGGMLYIGALLTILISVRFYWPLVAPLFS